MGWLFGAGILILSLASLSYWMLIRALVGEATAESEGETPPSGRPRPRYRILLRWNQTLRLADSSARVDRHPESQRPTAWRKTIDDLLSCWRAARQKSGSPVARTTAPPGRSPVLRDDRRDGGKRARRHARIASEAPEVGGGDRDQPDQAGQRIGSLLPQLAKCIREVEFRSGSVMMLYGGLHVEEVKARIRIAFGTLFAFEDHHGLPRKSVSDVLRGKSNARAVGLIEDFLANTTK